jgi:5-methylcytosine-specific restriction endonuclease McrA
MPLPLPRSCAYPTCPRVVTGATRCPEHAIPVSARSGTRARKMAHRMKIEQPWCTYCGSPATKGNDLTIDHIVPLSRGGTNRRENLTVACFKCNRAKSDGVSAVDAITRTASEKSNDVAIG